MSKNFIENLKGIMNNRTHVHHSHITGEIIGYAHSYCNQKVRQNYPKIAVVTHFFSSKRSESWCLENKRYFYRR